MNLLECLPIDLKWNILLRPELDNRDLINFGRVSKECFSLTNNQEFLKALFPYERLIPKDFDRRRFVLNCTFTREDEILPRIKCIVSRLTPRQSLDIQGSFIDLHYSPYMLNLFNSEIFSMGSGFNITEISKLMSVMVFDNTNLSELFASLSDVNLKPAFRYRINKDPDNCMSMKFIFRNAFRPQNYSINLKKELHDVCVKYRGVVDASESAIRFKSNDSFTIKYFNVDYSPHTYMTESDLLEFERCTVQICRKILENWTGWELKHINSFGDIQRLCIASGASGELISNYPISEDDLLEAFQDPMLEDMIIKVINRLSDIDLTIKKLVDQGENSLSTDCNALIKFSLKQFKPPKANGINAFLSTVLFLMVFNVIFGGEPSLEEDFHQI